MSALADAVKSNDEEEFKPLYSNNGHEWLPHN